MWQKRDAFSLVASHTRAEDYEFKTDELPLDTLHPPVCRSGLLGANADLVAGLQCRASRNSQPFVKVPDSVETLTHPFGGPACFEASWRGPSTRPSSTVKI
jgi:hypothetical protein